MTCIVGVADPGKGAVLGADTLGGDSSSWVQVASPKLYRPLPWLAYGFTTSWRFGQVLGHELNVLQWPPPARGQDALDWVVRSLVPAMRDALNGGFAKKENEQEEGGTAVLAVGDRVFGLNEDYAVLEYQSGVATCGSGGLVARVAAAVARDLDPTLPPADLAGLALRHAELTNPWVRGPFRFVTTSIE
jgi:hypothetical protein